jgi:hypothetical protein
LTKHGAAGMIEAALLIRRSATPLKKGGDAYGEQALGESPSLSGVFSGHAVHTDHKSVLTARLAPERST